VRRCKDAGIDHHFTKPVDPEKLQQLLDRAKAALDRVRRAVAEAKAIGKETMWGGLTPHIVGP
jgi:hypothetical protein